jgi:hypothetical protein
MLPHRDAQLLRLARALRSGVDLLDAMLLQNEPRIMAGGHYKPRRKSISRRRRLRDRVGNVIDLTQRGQL